MPKFCDRYITIMASLLLIMVIIQLHIVSVYLKQEDVVVWPELGKDEFVVVTFPEIQSFWSTF